MDVFSVIVQILTQTHGVYTLYKQLTNDKNTIYVAPHSNK